MALKSNCYHVCYILTVYNMLLFHQITLSHKSKPELHNVALQGRATQSSLSMWAGFALGSCTQTAEESSPWSRMDLHHNYVVYAIHAGSSSATVPSIPAGQTEYFKCKKIVKGRYVTVLPGNGTLSFCEVEVFLSPVVTSEKIPMILT
uniref:Fucolectin tachylectin-4 pentraxin-1 domain-containing protein n=1 Tax=Electrophorus electricus TaxID=8005 RepID=A0A4W4FMX7_ELEEL